MKDPLVEASQIAAMGALSQCGAFDEIVRRPTTATELAGRLSLNEGALRRALEVARALGFLCEREGVYAVDDRLVAGDQILALARMLPEHLRTGACLTRNVRDRSVLYAMVASTLAAMFGPLAEQLAVALADRPCEHILDVGAGSGVWSLAMAERHPGSMVTALDLAPVLPRFRERAGNVAYELIAGNYHEVALEPRWDRVLVANVLHLEPRDRARSLLTRASTWRRPGGRVVVVDAMFRSEASDLALASYELHLALRIEGGRVHEADAVRAWASQAGLEVESAHVLDAQTGLGALVLR